MTSRTPRYWCIVPAAGVGRRMGGERPKQYLRVLDKTICEHTLERLLRVPLWQQVLVCVSPQDDQWSGLPIASHPLIHVVAGGAERCDSVLNALHALRSTAAADDWVLVHDVARPCVDPNDIQRLIDTLASSDACGGILATPVRDTMKRADDQGCIQHSVERSGLWHALTPQMFRYGLLVTALQAACEAGVTITDEASALEWRGQHPRLIEGRPDNIKVTHPQDLALVALALSQQSGRYQ